jgi:erythronate-4-phosphate dehydrogenase
VINTSRGEVLDESALKSALKSGRLAGSVLDVWDNEPFIDRELLELVTIATPHIAGYSAEGKANGTAMVVQALANFFGLPPERWYPAVLPQPGNPMIALDTAGKTVEEAINEAVLHTYSVMSDDAMLRQSPGSFENLRSGYPPRREFPAYQIRLTGHDPKIRAALENLGLIFAGN